nr:protein iq-domain 1 [Ipomoea batatas]
MGTILHGSTLQGSVRSIPWPHSSTMFDFLSPYRTQGYRDQLLIISSHLRHSPNPVGYSSSWPVVVAVLASLLGKGNVSSEVSGVGRYSYVLFSQARRALRLERIGEASSYSLRMAARPWETRLLEQATSNSSKPCTAKVRKNNVTKRISTKPPEAVPKFL